MYHDKHFPPSGNPAIMIFFTNPVFIKYKYEMIDLTHTLITKIGSSYEASVRVGYFLKLTTVYGSLIVALSNSSNSSGEGGNWHLPCASPNSRISAWTILFLILF